MLRKLYLILLLVVTASHVHALEASFAHAVYYLPDPVYKGKINPYIEAYWQINPTKLRYNTNADKKIIARILTQVTITNDTGHIIKDDRYIYETKPSNNADELAYLNILELKRYFLTTGHLTINVKLTDLNDTNNKTSFTDTFTVSTQKSTFYGGIEYLDTFYASDIATPFRKHGKQNIPWCNDFFPTEKCTLNYYTELYLLDKIPAAEYPLTQSVFISKKITQEPFGSYMKLDTITSNETTFSQGSFDIKDLPSGNYYLNISLGNKQHQTITSRMLFFQRMNTNPISRQVIEQKAQALDTSLETVNVFDLNKTFLKKYDLIQIKAMLKMLLPVSDAAGTRTINGFLEKPEDMYMRYFIYNYFAAIDKDDPEKAWKAFSNKIREVNKLYTNHGKIGYETEKGFMYLRYGPPSEVIESINESGSLPYEIWQYNTLKQMNGNLVANSVILFYKKSNSDLDFKVLHTNISGEVHNAGWRGFLYNGPDGGTNLNSRAEQYIGNK